LILLVLFYKVQFDGRRSECGGSARKYNDTVFIVHTKKGEGSCPMTCLISWSLTPHKDEGVQREILEGRSTRPTAVVKGVVDLSLGSKLPHFFYCLFENSSTMRNSQRGSITFYQPRVGSKYKQSRDNTI
jgi:hypothetical protein